MIIGWALDVGSRTDFGGVAYVELLLDGAPVPLDENLQPEHQPAELLVGSGGFDFNYYGHPRDWTSTGCTLMCPTRNTADLPS